MKFSDLLTPITVGLSIIQVMIVLENEPENA